MCDCDYLKPPFVCAEHAPFGADRWVCISKQEMLGKGFDKYPVGTLLYVPDFKIAPEGWARVLAPHRYKPSPDVIGLAAVVQQIEATP